MSRVTTTVATTTAVTIGQRVASDEGDPTPGGVEEVQNAGSWTRSRTGMGTRRGPWTERRNGDGGRGTLRLSQVRVPHGAPSGSSMSRGTVSIVRRRAAAGGLTPPPGGREPAHRRPDRGLTPAFVQVSREPPDGNWFLSSDRTVWPTLACPPPVGAAPRHGRASPCAGRTRAPAAGRPGTARQCT